MLREIRRNFLEHHITVITNPLCYNLYEHCHYVDRILIYDEKAKKHHFLTNLKRCKEFVANELNDGIDYEYGFAPNYFMPNLRAAWLLYFSGVKHRVLFTEKYSKKSHSDLMGTYDMYFNHLLTSDELKHDVKKNINLLRLVDLEVEENHAEIWSTSQDSNIVDNLFIKLKIKESSIKIAVVLSTSVKSKDWPVERFIEVSKKLQEKYNISFILIGAGKTAEECAEKYMQNVSQSYNLINKTTLRQSYVVLTKCDLYLGGDTGPMHMAAVAGLGGIALFKAGKDIKNIEQDFPRRLYPWKTDMLCIQPEKCLPGCEQGCNHENGHCINQVITDEVYETMIKIIGK